MAKQSGLLKRLQAASEQERKRRDYMIIRQSLDMACIALNDAFGFGADRLRRFADAYQRTWMDYAHMTVDDASDDKNIVYSVAKFEEKLKSICGRYYVPREQRYD